MQSPYLKRTNYFFLFIVIVLAVLAGRLAYIQIIQHSEYNARQTRQSYIKVDIQPETGKILDRNGEILALSRLVNSVYVVPKDLANNPDEIQQIASILSMDTADLTTKITKCADENKYFLWSSAGWTMTPPRRYRSLISRALD